MHEIMAVVALHISNWLWRSRC